MKKDDAVYLKHISDAIAQIEVYVQDVEYEAFLANRMMQDAVIRQVEIIGEATKGLSNELREKHSKVPWKQMAGMRDKLIHDYLGVDIDSVWDTIINDIPLLKKKIETIIEIHEFDT